MRSIIRMSVEDRSKLNLIISQWQKDNHIDASMHYGGSPNESCWYFGMRKDIAVRLLEFLQANHTDLFNQMIPHFPNDEVINDVEHTLRYEDEDWWSKKSYYYIVF